MLEFRVAWGVLATGVATLLNLVACGEVPGHTVDATSDTSPSVDAPTPTGTPQSALAVGDSGTDVGESVIVDSDNTIVASGYFEGAIDVGGGLPLTSAGLNDIFLTRRGPMVGFTAPSGMAAMGRRRAKDRARRVGERRPHALIRGTTDLGNITAAGPSDALIADLTASLARVRSVSDNGIYTDTAYGIASDASGNLIAGGTFAYTAFGGQVVGDGLDGYLVKYDGNGPLVWAKDFGGGTGTNGPNEWVTSVAVDDANNVYAAGYFESNPVKLVGTSYPNQGGRDVFLCKLGPDGSVQWCHVYGGGMSDHDPTITVDNARNFYMAAYFNGTAAFGGPSLTATGQNCVIAKYDTSGGFIWQVQTSAAVKAIRFAGDELHVAGVFSGIVDFGPGGMLTSAGGGDCSSRTARMGSGRGRGASVVRAMTSRTVLQSPPTVVTSSPDPSRIPPRSAHTRSRPRAALTPSSSA